MRHAVFVTRAGSAPPIPRVATSTVPCLLKPFREQLWSLGKARGERVEVLRLRYITYPTTPPLPIRQLNPRLLAPFGNRPSLFCPIWQVHRLLDDEAAGVRRGTTASYWQRRSLVVEGRGWIYGDCVATFGELWAAHRPAGLPIEAYLKEMELVMKMTVRASPHLTSPCLSLPCLALPLPHLSYSLPYLTFPYHTCAQADWGDATVLAEPAIVAVEDLPDPNLSPAERAGAKSGSSGPLQVG